MKQKIIGSQLLAILAVSIFAFGSVVYADATIIDTINTEGNTNTSFGIYNNGELVVGQEEYINGTANRTRTISIDTSDEELRSYVESKEGEWSTSLLNDQSLANIIGQSVDYLEGREYNSRVADVIGSSLDSYFASDDDIQQLLRMIDDLQFKATNLNIRVAAIERTLEEMASEDYCNAKLETAKKYNLTINGLKCGLNSTYFYMNKDGTMTAIETYNPEVDPKPVKMTLIVPSAVFAGNTFSAGVLLNNTGSKFGAYKIMMDVPEGWEIEQESFTGTLADKETRTLYVKITPGSSKGTLSAGAKIVMSGKTYKLMAQSELSPILLEEGEPAPVVEEEKIFITANLLSNLEAGIGKLAAGTSQALDNISGNISEILDNVTRNLSQGSGEGQDAQKAMSDFDTLFGSVLK